MTLVRWTPARELASFPGDILSMQREINRLFNGFFRGGLHDDEMPSSESWWPAADVAENDTEYDVKMELPGVKKSDVQITLHDNVLTVRGEKKEESGGKGATTLRTERTTGSFQRSFTFSSALRSDGIEATYTDGILSIRLPKAEEAKPRQIEVTVR